MLLRFNQVIAVAFVLIGVAALVETIYVGGGTLGFLLAAVFLALGVMRWRALNSHR